MATVDFHPPLVAPLDDPWRLCAMRYVPSGRNAGTATIALVEADQPRALEDFILTSGATRQPCVEQFAKRSGLERDMIDGALMLLYGQIQTRLTQSKPLQPTGPYYAEDAEGLWLVQPLPTGEHREQLTNFSARILADITEDDGTASAPRFFELEVTQGERQRQVRLPAKDLEGMKWIADAIGARARILPGKYHLEHAHGALQELSPDIEYRHTYTHTGWRRIDDIWCYLHGAGAITAEGVRKDLSVALGHKFERYRLPLPVSGPEAHEALRGSLVLRTLGSGSLMTYPLGCAYLAPLREPLQPSPPDFVMWLLGKTGHYKSEYAALSLAHFGDFTRLTLPMSFETTGNGLERILHTPKDNLVVVDDYHPADSRREAEAMAQVASRLLRGMGNMGSRQRMKRDTSLQEELPPRCVALATGELLPGGHSNNARMFLVTLPSLTREELTAHGKALTQPQEPQARVLYAQAMATYVQWIAQQWATLVTTLPARLAVLQQEAVEAGEHTREPGQVAYLQLAWETFTQCALDLGAISADEREAILSDTKALFLHAVEEHAAILQRENTVRRCLDYLRGGLASKQLYLRNTEDEIPDESPGAWDGRLPLSGMARQNSMYRPMNQGAPSSSAM